MRQNAILLLTIRCVVLAATYMAISAGALAAPIDDARVAAAGIRKLPGKRLTLYTDLSGAEIDGCRRCSNRRFRNGAAISA